MQPEVELAGVAVHVSPPPTADGLPPGASPNQLSIAAGPDGNLWYSAFSDNQVGRIDPATGAITAFAVGGGSGPDPGPALDTRTGGSLEFPHTAGGAPTEITAGPDGALWFAELGYRLEMVPVQFPPPSDLGAHIGTILT